MPGARSFFAFALTVSVITLSSPPGFGQDNENWADKPAISKALEDVKTSFPAKRGEACAAMHGPLPPAIRQRLLEGAIIVVDDEGDREEHSVSTAMLRGDSFCLDNSAECAVSRPQLYYCSSDEAIFLVEEGGFFTDFHRIVAVKTRPEPEPVAQKVTGPVFSGSSRNLPANGKNCSIRSGAQNVSSVNWSGSCEDGYASGSGLLQWKQGDEVIWSTQVGPQWGMRFEEGVLHYNLDLSDFKFRLRSCRKEISGYRGVRIDAPKVPGERYFANQYIESLLLTRAAEFANDTCPVPDEGMSNIDVVIVHDGETVVSARNYSADELNWREHTNRPARQLSNRLEEEAERQERRQRQAAAERRAERIEERFRKRRQALIDEVEAFWTSGEGTPRQLAAAVVHDQRRTLQRLEKGIELVVPATESLETRNVGGERYYMARYSVASPFEKLEDARLQARQEEGFSWDDFFQQTQTTGMTNIIRTVCLYPSVGDTPESARTRISGKLMSFDGSGQDIAITLECRQ